MGELAVKVRAKYPGAYDAIPDAELESKIVAKFPGVYDHLVAKPETRVSGNPDASPAETERMRRKFAEQEDPSILGSINRGLTRVKNAITPDIDRRAVANMVRPTLEGLGAASGELMGAPFAPVTAGTSIPALGGLGYAAGKGVSDFIEGRQDTTMSSIGRDIKTGAQYTMGGALGAKALEKAIPVVAKSVRSLRETTKTAPTVQLATGEARKTLASMQTLTTQEAKNLAEAVALEKRLGIAPLTPAQRTGKPTTQAIEQGLAIADPSFAGQLTARDTAAKVKALSRIQDSIGGAKPLPAGQDLATTGQNLTETITGAMKPVKEAERKLWEAVPNYTIPTSATDTAFKTAMDIPSSAEGALKDIKALYDRMPKTTQGLHRIESEIGSRMQSATQTERKFLGDIKKAINEDFNMMGEASKTGQLSLHNGQVVYPAKLEAEYAANLERIAAEKAANAAKPDTQAMAQALTGKGYPAMRQTAESEASYAQRMTKAYEQNFSGQPVPTLTEQSTKGIDSLTARNQQIEKIFSELQPAEDLAKAYTTAKDFTRTQVAARFKKGAVKNVLGRGDQSSGFRTADENVGRQFFTPSGSTGLIKAVGQKAATEQMRPFVVADMLKSAAPDGVTFNVQSGINYIQKNRSTLERLGLVDDARQILKDQFPAMLERELAASAVDQQTGKQFLTADKSRKLLQKHGNTIKQLYGAETLAKFRDYNQLINLIDRKNLVPRSTGSNTAEKAIVTANAMIANSTGPAAKLTDGLLGAIMQGTGGGAVLSYLTGGATTAAGASLMAAKQMIKNASKQEAQTFAEILKEATLNPQLAKDLMTVKATGKVPSTLKLVIKNKLATATSAAVGQN